MAHEGRQAGRAPIPALTPPRLAFLLILLAIVAAGIGRRELFTLTAEDPARSLRRFLLGPRDVVVTPGAPWARVPAWLPGPADEWAGGTTHAIVVPLEIGRPRALRLEIQTSGAHPAETVPFVVAPGGATTSVRVEVNGQRVARVEVPAPGPQARGPRVAAREWAALAAGALGAGGPVEVALVNEGRGVGLRHIRLGEARLSLALSHLARTGAFPLASGRRARGRPRASRRGRRRSYGDAVGPSLDLARAGPRRPPARPRPPGGHPAAPRAPRGARRSQRAPRPRRASCYP